MSDTANRRILSLSCGTLTLGLAECAMMAILPETAIGLGVSIPTAGEYISAYALGVCVGAPVISVLTKSWSLKRILIMLAWMMLLGNLLTAFSINHGMMLLLRFVSGLPHGAFFGASSIVAERLSVRGKEAQTTAVMLMGISASNVIGVPIASLLAHYFSWHASFVFTGIWGGVTLLAVHCLIPPLPAMSQNTGRSPFVFLKKPAPWLLLGATLLANSGYFCFYSYIKPFFTEVAQFNVNIVSVWLFLAGISMCAGTWLCGKYSDRVSPGRTAIVCLILLSFGLLGIFFYGTIPTIAVLCTCIVSGCVFGVGLCWQVLILKHARGGEMMGTACIQIAFNGGNALGAFLGGLPLQFGLSPAYTAVPGFILLLFAIVLLGIFITYYEHSANINTALT